MKDAFETDGFVRVPGVIAPDVVRAMRDELLARIETMPFVEMLGARRPGPGTEAALWEIGRAPVFAPLAGAVERAIERGLGAADYAPVSGGLAAPNLPLPGAAWTVPREAWHVDEPAARGEPRAWALLGFVLLDVVEPGGGATVMVAGSHRRLVELAPVADPALALAGEPWRVVELTGDAGDVVLMDPRCLHTVSANVRRPRLQMRVTCGR